jgi:hypothetical protein
MNEVEYKALVDKVGADVAAQIKAATEPLQNKLNAFEEASKSGASAESVKAIEATVKAENEKLEGILKAQGLVITDLQNKLQATVISGDSVMTVLESVKSDIARVYAQKTGQVEIRLGYEADKNGKMHLVAKAADVHNTTTAGANASITQSVTTAAILRTGSDSDAIETIQRSRPWILDFVSVGNTLASSLAWFDEVPKQGAFAVTAEGAVKPLNMYTFNRTSSDYRKVAGRAKITEEFNNDFPRLVSTIKDLMSIDCRNAMNDLILTDMIANATAYSNAGLVGTINNATDWDAIAAAAGQLGNAYYTPNVLVMNNNRGIISATSKDTTNQYIDYMPVLNEIAAGSLKIIKHPSVGVGKFFIGDGSVYKVLLKGDLVVRIGYSNDDFDRNQYSLVVEQYFYSYIPTARKAGLVYGDFAAIKASIETA